MLTNVVLSLSSFVSATSVNLYGLLFNIIRSLLHTVIVTHWDPQVVRQTARPLKLPPQLYTRLFDDTTAECVLLVRQRAARRFIGDRAFQAAAASVWNSLI